MKRLSVSVMAYAGRSAWFPYLRERLGDVPFAIDEPKGEPGHVGVWTNCRRAWEMHDPSADYHVVIQDDAIVCDRFQERAEAFIELHHHDGECRAFNFYYGNKTALMDDARKGMKQGFVVRSTPFWGVAICMPTKTIAQMLRFCDQFEGVRQDDERIKRFIKSRGMKIYYPMPSLIDHRTGKTSLVGDPGQFRRAFAFVDKCKDEDV